MRKIRRGDDVVVLAGRDKGKRGVVLRCVRGVCVVVEGVNRAKKHVRPNPSKGIVGGVLEQDRPLHISNVAHYDGFAKKAGRIGVGVLEDGSRVRCFKSDSRLVGA